jgi:hypothetical protein
LFNYSIFRIFEKKNIDRLTENENDIEMNLPTAIINNSDRRLRNRCCEALDEKSTYRHAKHSTIDAPTRSRHTNVMHPSTTPLWLPNIVITGLKPTNTNPPGKLIGRYMNSAKTIITMSANWKQRTNSPPRPWFHQVLPLWLAGGLLDISIANYSRY